MGYRTGQYSQVVAQAFQKEPTLYTCIPCHIALVIYYQKHFKAGLLYVIFLSRDERITLPLLKFLFLYYHLIPKVKKMLLCTTLSGNQITITLVAGYNRSSTISNLEKKPPEALRQDWVWIVQQSKSFFITSIPWSKE